MTEKIKTLCIHHNDADGYCSGAIVKYFEKDVTTVSMNYGYDIPWKKIKEAKKVYMVDFGLQPFSEMIKLSEMKGDNLIWIDHHKTSIEDMEKSGRSFKGLQIIGQAGCELTWQYFTEDRMPLIVRLIGRYDVWDLEYSPFLFDLQAGLKYVDVDADDDEFWQRHFRSNQETDELIKKGEICNKYQQNLYNSYVNSHSFSMSWEGYNFLVCNALNVNSKLFDIKFDKTKYDAVMAFGYTNKKWSISMYTDKSGIDVGSLAKKYGGGGHTGAAGMQCPDGLPFELPNMK